MNPAVWVKFGRFRVNLAQVAVIERDVDVLRFYAADGREMFVRAFDSDRQADRVLKEVFKFEELRLINASYEGSEPSAGAAST